MVKDSAYRLPYTKKTKPRRPVNYPKRPLSGYLLFAGERRAAVTKSHGMKGGKVQVAFVMKKIASEWNALSAGKKKPYLTKGRKALDAHKAIFASYKKTQSYKGWRQEIEDWKEMSN